MNLQIIQEQAEIYKYNLKQKNGRSERSEQLDSIVKTLKDHFSVEGPINIIETGASHNWNDGMMGLFFAQISQQTGGKMWMVDIDENIISRAKQIFQDEGITCVEFVVDDSVSFLKKFNDKVDLVHLDSWDLDLMNPFPSALHGWREFDAIKDKLTNDTIVIVDDNFLDGTWVNWNHMINGEFVSTERVTISYPCVGKGSHIWWWVQQPENGWKLLSENTAGQNIKVICKKN